MHSEFKVKNQNMFKFTITYLLIRFLIITVKFNISSTLLHFKGKILLTQLETFFISKTMHMIFICSAFQVEIFNKIIPNCNGI